MLRLKEDHALKSAWVERPEYLSSMYVRSKEGNRPDGRFIFQFQTKKNKLFTALHCMRPKQGDMTTGENISTLDNESVGNETPKKKPKIIPTKVVMKSLIISFGFLIPLQIERK